MNNIKIQSLLEKLNINGILENFATRLSLDSFKETKRDVTAFYRTYFPREGLLGKLNRTVFMVFFLNSHSYCCDEFTWPLSINAH